MLLFENKIGHEIDINIVVFPFIFRRIAVLLVEFLIHMYVLLKC